MNLALHKQKTVILLLGLLFSLSSYSQKLLTSRQTSYYTYIYTITNKEAEKVYKKDTWKIDTSFFHTLIDSFPTDSQYYGKLQQGHYLKTFAENNKQKLSITTVQDFEIYIFNNNTDLCIQVFDLKGNLIENADIRIRWKKLKFNKKTQSYLDKKSNQKGLLQVTHNGFTAYYDLSRQYNNSFVKRGTRKVVYGTPLKYVWMPVNFVIFLPIDGVKSIANGWPEGTIFRTKNFFVKSFNKIACLFDDYYCDSYTENKFRNKHTGYMVFNKPKYLPGDTVKFKAFIVTKKGKAIDKNVRVILQNNRKDIELTKLAPYRSGGYEYEFYLHDSLQLQLDRNYTVRLELNDRKEFINGSFKYEDYELAKNQLFLRVDSKEHFRNKRITLYVKGTDENDLNLMDASFEVILTPKSINKYFENHTFIPDTLLYLKKKLKPTDETEVVISDSTFPNANFDYTIYVRMLSSDNETISKDQDISYFYKSEKFDIKVKTDSIHFEYLKNGEVIPKQVNINSEDNFGNKTSIYNGLAPCNIELNPYYSSYTIRTDSISESIAISNESSLLQCLSERTADSVFIVVNNPRKIPFIYNIYKKSRQQSSGYTDSLNIHKKSNTKQNYFVSIRYLWGGQVKEENYRIPLIDKKLNISVTQPKIVYPGQKTRIDILVTDTKGNPVKGVDLTAFSLTKKFDYSAPELPYLGKVRKNKSVINNFNLKDFNLKMHSGLQLDYNAWKILAGIDSIEYYKFIYPKNTIYRFDYNTEDSITQFAPFVVSAGEILPVHVIYVDSKPVYFSWSTNTRPYSFAIDSGYHQIKLRTTFREISIDSMYFEKGRKMIFSLDQDSENTNYSIKKVEAKLSDFEKRILFKYIVPYRNNFGEQYAYFKQNGNIQFLTPESRYQRNNLAGPLVGNLNFQLIDSFSTTFNHEPFFEYEFLPELLKMRSINSKRYPAYLNNYNTNYTLTDAVLTKETLHKQWKDYLNSKRHLSARYRYPNSTSEEAGKLLINFRRNNEPIKDIPLNVLVFRYDNHEFLRVYPGNTSFFHELQKGYHKLIFFYSGAKYHIEDSVFIEPNGLNYYEFETPSLYKKDTFSLYVSNLIEETLFKPIPYYENEERELKQIYNMYQQQFKYTGVGDIAEGYVYEEESGEPLPGVSVVIKGTTYGTLTNLDGYYTIKIPPGNNTLNFSFVGFIPEERQLGYNGILNVNLKADYVAIDEVVVIGYGVQKKSMLASSISTVTTSSLLGGIPGVSGNISRSLQGKVAGVEILTNQGSTGDVVEIRFRGHSSVSFDKSPLYIINGNVYTGDISELDPSIIQHMEILKDANATAIYGSRGANGVVIIETQAGSFKPTQNALKGAEYDNTFLEAASQESSIRNNFSDYAFWYPDLITDKKGKAGFEVIFPDDVTSWETFYLAMNNKQQSGQTEGLIKSYKPLMAQLAVPRFLVQSDTTNAIGKVLNYTPDSVEVEKKFEVGNKEMLSSFEICINSLIDTLPIVATDDSLTVKYFLTTKDGYFDGEQKDIPVFQKGLEAVIGNFYLFDKDTTLQMQFDTTLGTVNLYARADILDVIEDEINHLTKYKYSCNEQLASKLKALLAEKNIAYFKGQKFSNDNDTERLIRLLTKNQKENGLWGWWKNSDESLWISFHIIEALTHAEQLGYRTSINKNQITELLIWELESSRDFYEKIQILKILNLLGSQINYRPYISDLEKTKNISLNGLLNIIELKQLCGMDYNLDTLNYYKRASILGNVFYSDENKETNLVNNDIQNSLLAYKIFKADSATNNQTLIELKNYFLEKRKNGYWRNTYESAQIIETILPDLLNGQAELSQPELTFKGDLNRTITEFPFEMKINPTQKINVSKTGDFPAYLTSYQRFWDNNPDLKKKDFEISTRFENKSISFLTAGQETKLITKVTVKKDAEYVMINIPIPGGCTYADKKNNLRNESHREYFKNETTIFCDYLPQGEYTFEIDLLPRYTGTYTVNPAKVELMYFPTFNANNEIKIIKIK
ncbi:MAG: carboxypeptidase-like regulatory domain-containing protein [Salinivirgaceae bacterium]